jgi:ketosteroid isomerase-like protein
MSKQNVEVIRRLFAAIESEEFQEVLNLFDPEVEWAAAEGTAHGIDGVVTSFVEWMEPWDEHHIEPEEFLECDDGRVLATIHLSARGGQSGMEIDQRFFQLYTVREGKIARMVEYVDRPRALEAAGLRE